MTIKEVDALVRDVRPLLRGHHRSVQWAVLAELVALWAIEHAAVRSVILEPLAQHPRQDRAQADRRLHSQRGKDDAGPQV